MSSAATALMQAKREGPVQTQVPASPEQAAQVRAYIDALTEDQFNKMINDQRRETGTLWRYGQSMLHSPHFAESTREALRKWIAKDSTPCRAALFPPLAHLQFYIPAPKGMKCTFPNGLTKPAVIVPDKFTASTASTARGGKRKATRNTRKMRNKRRATRRRR